MKDNNNTNNEQEQVVSDEDSIIVHSIEDDIKAIGASNEAEEEESSETDGKQEPKEVQQEPRKPRAKKRIQNLTKKNKDLERENKDLEREIEELIAKELIANKSTGKSQGNYEANGENAPDIDDFDSFDEFDEALEKFNDSRKADEQKEETSNVEVQREVEAFENLDILLDDAKDKYSDFDEVVQNPDLIITLDLMESLTEFEDGAGDMLYNLANDTELLAELVALTPKQQYKRLVLLENDLDKGVVKQAKQKKGSNAPEPISPVGGKGNRVLSLDDDDLTYEETEALMNRSSTSQRGGFL